MSSVEIKVGQKWVATKDVAFWKKGTTAEITEIGGCIRFKNSDGQEEFIFNNPEDVVWFKSIYELVADDQANKEMGTAESIRSKILSIREKRNDLKMEIIALDKEEAELVEKLKQQGFVLYESALQAPTEKKTVLYADDIEEDMSDPKNWKVGDILEQHKYSFKPTFTPITKIEDGEWWTKDNDGRESWGEYGEMKSIFKFHSRPL